MLIFTLVVLADVFIVYSYYQVVQHFVEEQPRDVSADAGIIFFGDYNSNGTQLGPDSRRRALEAIDLYKKRKIRSVVCVGGYDIRRWKGKPHLMKQFLIENGVPKNDIINDSLSFNTITNWQEACKIINSREFKKVVAISAPLHVYRIHKMVDADSVLYHAYQYSPSSMGEYWQVFKDVHREFVSRFLSLALKDKIRNKIVRVYRTLWHELDRVL